MDTSARWNLLFIPVLRYFAGETEKRFAVEILYDNEREPTETFTVCLDQPVNAEIGHNPMATVCIQDRTPEAPPATVSAPPIVVSLMFYENIHAGVNVPPSAGYPVVCLTVHYSPYTDFYQSINQSIHRSINRSIHRLTINCNSNSLNNSFDQVLITIFHVLAVRSTASAASSDAVLREQGFVPVGNGHGCGSWRQPDLQRKEKSTINSELKKNSIAIYSSTLVHFRQHAVHHGDESSAGQHLLCAKLRGPVRGGPGKHGTRGQCRCHHQSRGSVCESSNSRNQGIHPFRVFSCRILAVKFSLHWNGLLWIKFSLNWIVTVWIFFVAVGQSENLLHRDSVQRAVRVALPQHRPYFRDHSPSWRHHAHHLHFSRAQYEALADRSSLSIATRLLQFNHESGS